MKLEYLQKLPHKWWKKNQRYIPCRENILVDSVGFITSTNHNFDVIEKIKAIDNIEFYNNVTPTKYDWYFAINTELMEYLETKDADELADIAVFCGLCLKNHYKVNLLNTKYDVMLDRTFYVEPIYSNLYNPEIAIFRMFKWALTSDKILSKIKYNETRRDHVCVRR